MAHCFRGGENVNNIDLIDAASPRLSPAVQAIVRVQPVEFAVEIRRVLTPGSIQEKVSDTELAVWARLGFIISVSSGVRVVASLTPGRNDVRSILRKFLR
ncbi:hypothetical protein [Rhodopirellula baltica]